MFRRKPRLVDKIAEGMSMVLSGPSPTFATFRGTQRVFFTKDDKQPMKR